MSLNTSLYFYILCFSVFILFMVLFDLSYKRNHKKMSLFVLMIILALLTIISGFRYHVGTDFNSYIYMYHAYDYLEPGSRILFQFANHLSSNPQTIIVIYSFFTNFILLCAIYKFRKWCNSSMILASYLFVYLPFSFNIIRQSLAMAICLLAFAYLMEEKKKKAVICLLVASLFHSSAIILLPYMLLIAKSKKEKIIRNTVITTLGILFVIVFYTNILSKVEFFSQYINYFSEISFTSLECNILLAYLPFLILVISFQKSIHNSFILSSLSGLFLSGVLFEFLLSSSELSRIGLYFSELGIFLFPMLIAKIKDEFSKKTINIFYFVFLVVYFIVIYFAYGRTQIFPYNNILFS